MPVVASSTPVRRLLVELLAEARARTILLVSSLSDEEMRSRPDAAVQPILSELDEILRFEERWLEGEAGHQETSPRSVIGSYNEWFDAMLEVRQRTLDRLEACAGEPAVMTALSSGAGTRVPPERGDARDPPAESSVPGASADQPSQRPPPGGSRFHGPLSRCGCSDRSS